MRKNGWLLLVAGFVLAALNLRPALAGVSPLLGEIMSDLSLSPAAAGAITTIMLLCLGLLGPLGPILSSRLGLDRTLMAGMLLLIAGVVIRSSGGVFTLYLGAAMAGTAIAFMNVIMPGLVKQHFPDRVGLFTGLYVTSLVSGAALGSAVMVPLAQEMGWRWAAATTAIFALVSAIVWLPQVLKPPVPPAPQAPRPFRALMRRRVTWYVATYMGVQSMTFYIMLAWLPTIFTDAGLSADDAGYLLGLTNVAQIAATLTVPLHAGKAKSQVPHVVGAAVITIVGYLGVLFWPTTLPWLWMIVLGVGQGASIALALLIITLRAPDPRSVTALSAVAQSTGYTLAAVGPVVIGAIYQVSGDWTVPLVVGLGVCGVQLVLGYLAARQPQGT